MDDDTSLPLFDCKAALSRLNGDKKLLHKLALLFLANYTDTCPRLQQLITEQHYEEAQRLAHNLKGAAIMLNIDELPAVAGAVEQAICERSFHKINLFIKVLETVLISVIYSLEILTLNAAESD